MSVEPGKAKEAEPSRITRLLRASAQGDREAQSELLSLVGEELRKIARARLRGLKPGETMTTTILSHDAYLRLVGKGVSWESRKHFFCVASKVMRRMLVSEARRRGRIRHGGLHTRVALVDEAAAADSRPLDLIALDEALVKLEHEYPKQHEVVMLRYFCGLSIDEAAEVLVASASSVDRLWRFARAWLLRELG